MNAHNLTVVVTRNTQVGLKDVAAAAGVSHQTVSRVINDHPNVKPETRIAVLAIIEQLGYRRNEAARSLASGKISSVTILTPNTTLLGYAATIGGIEEQARTAGLSVGIAVIESEQAKHVSQAVERVLASNSAAIVIAYDQVGFSAIDMLPADYPYAAAVELPTKATAEDKPWLWLDDRKAAREATYYLLDKGNRTVHHLAIPSSTKAGQRAQGWKSALTARKIPVPATIALGWTAKDGYEAGKTLAANPEVTAILCGNDELAIGCMRALVEAGRKVGTDVSVIGFDDSPHSAYLSPSLSSIRLDFHGLGRACVELVSARLRGEEYHPTVQLTPPQLIHRESSL